MTELKKPRYSILLAGDDDVLLNVLSQIFSREGFEVTFGPDEGAIRSAIDKKKPDVFILDISRTPSKALRTLDSIGEDIRRRTIILASQSDIAHLQSMTTNVADDLIAKPFAMAELLTHIINRTAKIPEQGNNTETTES